MYAKHRTDLITLLTLKNAYYEKISFTPRAFKMFKIFYYSGSIIFSYIKKKNQICTLS